MIDFDFVEKPCFYDSLLDLSLCFCVLFGQSFEERKFLERNGNIEGVLKDGEF